MFPHKKKIKKLFPNKFCWLKTMFPQQFSFVSVNPCFLSGGRIQPKPAGTWNCSGTVDSTGSGLTSLSNYYLVLSRIFVKIIIWLISQFCAEYLANYYLVDIAVLSRICVKLLFGWYRSFEQSINAFFFCSWGTTWPCWMPPKRSE